MTAIAGFWNHESRPNLSGKVARMLSAQEIYGPDGPAIWSGDSIALGRGLSRVLPEDIFDRGPGVSPDGNLTLVGDARLDNREDLCAELRLSGSAAAVLCDAAVALEAFTRWGDRAIERFEGDFAIAVWNRRDRSLTLARDFAGMRPLHYCRGAGFFALASMPKGLHALAEIPRYFDRDKALDSIRMMPDNGPRSYFAGIERVEPGQIVTVTPGGIAKRRFWSPPVRKLRLRNSEEYAEGLRDHLDRAVRMRLRGSQGHVATHLSAGFDSASVTAAAASLLLRQGGAVTAFTAAPRKDYDFPAETGSRYIFDESELAATTAAMYPNVEHVVLRAGHLSPFASLDRDCCLYECPLVNVVNFPWIHAINDAARERKLTILLTGASGNLTASYNGLELLPELLVRGRWWKLLRESRALVKRGGRTWRSVASMAWSPVLPGRFRPANRRAPGPSRDSISRRVTLLGHGDPGNMNKGVLGGWGIDLRDPTADKRLFEFCLSIPTGEFLSGGITRALARRAFSGRLPPALLNERRMGMQAADWFDGMTAGRQQAMAELRNLELCEPVAEMLDLPALRRLTEAWPASEWARDDVRAQYRHLLARGIAVGAFLRRACEPVPTAV